MYPRKVETVRLAYLDLSWLISSHMILFILPAEHPRNGMRLVPMFCNITINRVCDM
jgi:hypothetical protein